MNTKLESDVQEVLSNVLNRHITLGVEAIFSTMLSGQKASAVSFPAFLNRIMMVAQVPITFVVFEENTKGELTQIYRANKHPRHSKQINDKCRDIKSKDPLFQMWQTKYHLLVLQADSKYNFVPLTVVKSIFEVEDIWSAASFKIYNILMTERYSDYKSTFMRYLEDIIGRCRDANYPPIDRPSCPNIDAEHVTAFNQEMITNNTTRYQLVGKGVMDRVYGKLASSLFSLSNPGRDQKLEDGRLPNFIFFSRDYNTPSDYKRYEVYDYNLQVLVGSKQKERIEKYFKWLNDDPEGRDKKKLYMKHVKNLDSSNKNAKDLALQINEIFWKKLKSESGRNELLEIMQLPLSKETRSMADPVFDGVSFYRAPFAGDAGMGRCFILKEGEKDIVPSNYDSNTELWRQKELLRVVMFQYLFEAMASQGSDDLWVMVNPIEISAKIYGVVAYATRSQDPDLKFEDEESIKDYNAFWLQNYHFYTDINEKLKRNLRTYMNSFYEDYVSKIYAKWFVKLVDRLDSGEAKSIHVAQNELNTSLASTSRIFPYDIVEIIIVPVQSESLGMLPKSDIDNPAMEHQATLTDRWAAQVEISPNTCFPSLVGYQKNPDEAVCFVNKSDIAVKMSDAILNSIVLESYSQGEMPPNARAEDQSDTKKRVKKPV